MIEVFKTNVESTDQALRLITALHCDFPGYRINFDLDDVDRILRVDSRNLPFDTDSIIRILRHAGFDAEVLADQIVIPGGLLQTLEIHRGT